MTHHDFSTKGGQSKSPAKRKASQQNAEKARKALAAKRNAKQERLQEWNRNQQN